MTSTGAKESSHLTEQGLATIGIPHTRNDALGMPENNLAMNAKKGARCASVKSYTDSRAAFVR